MTTTTKTPIEAGQRWYVAPTFAGYSYANINGQPSVVRDGFEAVVISVGDPVVLESELGVVLEEPSRLRSRWEVRQ